MGARYLYAGLQAFQAGSTAGLALVAANFHKCATLESMLHVDGGCVTALTFCHAEERL